MPDLDVRGCPKPHEKNVEHSGTFMYASKLRMRPDLIALLSWVAE